MPLEIDSYNFKIDDRMITISGIDGCKLYNDLTSLCIFSAFKYNDDFITDLEIICDVKINKDTWIKISLGDLKDLYDELGKLFKKPTATVR
jgi:hypothetical protein